MTEKELKSLVKLCRKNGITSIKTKDVELVLSPESMALEKPKQQIDQDDSIEEDKKLTDEELLYWSSAGLPTEDGRQ